MRGEGWSRSRCDEAAWADVQNASGCDDCTAVVQGMDRKYGGTLASEAGAERGGTCDGYCHAMQMTCKAAWTNANTGPTSPMTCASHTNKSACDIPYAGQDKHAPANLMCECVPEVGAGGTEDEWQHNGGNLVVGVCPDPRTTCHNTIGSFECACRFGFSKQAAFPFECEDVQECAIRNGGCGEHVTCIELAGSAHTGLA